MISSLLMVKRYGETLVVVFVVVVVVVTNGVQDFNPLGIPLPFPNVANIQKDGSYMVHVRVGNDARLQNDMTSSMA